MGFRSSSFLWVLVVVLFSSSSAAAPRFRQRGGVNFLDSLAHAHRTILAMPPAPLGRYLPPARHPPREVAAMDSYIDFLRKASNAAIATALLMPPMHHALSRSTDAAAGGIKWALERMRKGKQQTE